MGKRQPEDEIEKQVSAKKHKIEEVAAGDVAMAEAAGDVALAEAAGDVAVAELRKRVDASVHQKLLLRTGYTKELVFIDSQHYRAISVELQINCWALNALLQCNLFEDSLHNKYLLVQGRWIKSCLEYIDRVGSVNSEAHPILRPLYKWTSSPESVVHDSALHRHRPCLLYKAMMKVFDSLLHEFRELGATIVFANCLKIIIGTGEYDLSAAKIRCNNLLQTIKSRDQFQWVEFEPLQFWHSLLFVDQYNYCGKPQNFSGTGTTSLWNFIKYLPRTVQVRFGDIVSAYVHWNYLFVTATIEIINAGAPEFELVMMKSIKKEIVSYLMGLVIEGVTYINSPEGMGMFDKIFDRCLQVLSAYHRQRVSVDIELIKNVCGVLSFDKSVKNIVEVLRKNLFKYIGAKSWPHENIFQYDGCHSFILPNVTCRHCYYSRDLDLCCDLSLLIEEWCCPVLNCSKPYDRDEMESSLMQIIHESVWRYLHQEIVCTDCNLVSKSVFGTYCKKCGHKLTGTVDLGEFKRQLRFFLMIASSQKFQILEETCEFHLR